MPIIRPSRHIIKPLPGTPLAKGHPSLDGLVGFWPMNEGGGTKVFDASGNGLMGAISGATWAAGRDDSCLYFDGNDYVTIADPSATLAMNHGSGWSASFWINIPLTVSNTTMSLLAKYATGQYCFELRGLFYTSGIVQLGVEAWTLSGTGISSFSPWQSPSNWYNDQWRYVVYTVTQAGQSGAVVSLYGDGVLVGTGSLNDDTGSSTASLTVGYRPSSRYAIGRIDDVRIFDRALTPSEIASLYADPWQGFRRRVIPRLVSGGEPPAGLSIPVAMNHYNRMRRAG